MTQAVSDEVLGKFARKQADWFRRIRDGSLDLDTFARAAQKIIDTGAKPTGDPSATYSETFCNIPVRYTGEKTIRNYIEMDNYSYVSPEFSIDHLHQKYAQRESGVEMIDVVLVSFEENAGGQKVFEAFKAYDYGGSGLRSATFPELMALNHHSPELRSNLPLVILQAIHKDIAPNISTHGEDRRTELRVAHPKYLWLPRTRFVGVRTYI